MLHYGDQSCVQLRQQVLALLHDVLILRELHDKCDNEIPYTMFLIFRKNFPSSIDRLVKDLESVKLGVRVLCDLQDSVYHEPGIGVRLKLIEYVIR